MSAQTLSFLGFAELPELGVTWDALAATAVVAAAVWALRWSLRRGPACAKCPAAALARQPVARPAAAVTCCRPVRRKPCELSLGRPV